MDFLNIFLNKEHSDPLYYQLYSYLAGQIRSGDIQAKEKLPGKRTAAGQLGVSVNTVDTAYQMLEAEGYVTARPRSGFVVNKIGEGVQLPPHLNKASAVNIVPIAEQPGTQAKRKYSFSTGDIDTGLFPRKTWNRLLREIMAEKEELFARGNGMGENELRHAIAQYLQGYRGVRCGAGQIVVGAGLEVLVGLLARIIPEKVVGLENPGYPKAWHILQNMGSRVVSVEVDGDGMRLDALQRTDAEMIYLTPSHQFPTGAVMPVGRRMELLRWAQAGGRLILEDDYDSEFRFDGRPLPSLQGLDESGHVVYAGTFSRSLAPGLRIAYLVLPPALLDLWQQKFGDYACTVSRPEQQTLARFMMEGHFARSLNRARNIYKKRRELVLQALKEYLPKASYTVANVHTGLYFVLHLPGHDAEAFAVQARRQGVYIRALAEYQTGVTEGYQDALVLGYGGLNEEKVDTAVQALCRLINT